MTFNVLVAVLALATAEPLPTPQSLPVISVHSPHAVLRVQVAKTPAQRERGLMSVKHLARHTGMVFVFDKDGAVDFWMKDTLIPLDMVFIATDGTVRTVFPNVPVVPRSLADSDIPIEAGTAKYVIELPAGEAATDGLATGSRVSGLPR